MEGIFLPTLTGLLILSTGYKLGTKGSIQLSMLSFSLLNLSLLWTPFSYTKSFPAIFNLGSWMKVGMTTIDFCFVLDPLSLLMSLLVGIISSLVFFYSIGYIGNDPHYIRFLGYYNLFVGGMLLLVTAQNFLILFLGWEIIGIISYLLINFWFLRISANQAAISAVLYNKVGDIGFLLGISLLFAIFKSTNFSIVFALAEESSWVTMVCLFLFLGAVSKSAQLGLHTWLLYAMEGPTPVSALLHSATMVSSGCYLIIRASYLFESAPSILILILLWGSVTALVAGLIGYVTNDIKGIIAYSTCSQLGYLMTAIGSSQFQFAFFHLLSHGFFKALLFLSAGSVIHALSNEQDIRKMGGMIKLVPITACTALLGSFALVGVPFFSGFYSKDLILEGIVANWSIEASVAYLLVLFTVFSTAFYSIRLYYLVYLGESNAPKSVMKESAESSFFLLVPMILLSVFAIFFGYVAKDIVGLGSNFFTTSIYQNTLHSSVALEFEFLPWSIKTMPLFFILGAVGFFHVALQQLSSKINEKLLFQSESFLFSFVRALVNKFYIETLINRFTTSIVLTTSKTLFIRTLDRGVLEYFGPHGFVQFFFRILTFFPKVSSGSLYHYLLASFIGVVLYFVTFQGDEGQLNNWFSASFMVLVWSHSSMFGWRQYVYVSPFFEYSRFSKVSHKRVSASRFFSDRTKENHDLLSLEKEVTSLTCTEKYDFTLLTQLRANVKKSLLAASFEREEVSLFVRFTDIESILRWLKHSLLYSYTSLIYMVGVDLIGLKNRWKVVYILRNVNQNADIKIITHFPEQAFLASVTRIFPNANWYEREIFEFFGILFRNHPDLRRLLTDYGFVGYPFRKDYPISGYEEINYSISKNQIIHTKLEITQEHKAATFTRPWISKT